VDIRLIAATNRDLTQEIRAGNFREDLYYRLNVIKIEMPPLRERKSDIPHLVEYFAANLGNRLNGQPFGVTPEAMEVLKSYPWPGNIRELENILERTIVLMEGDVIRTQDLPVEIADPDQWRRGRRKEDKGIHVKKGEEYRESLEDFEKQYLSGLLEEAGGNVSEAARRAGISRRNFYEKLEKLGLAARDFKE
jgi:DNA-binding NtrC family response regulator